MSKLKMKDKNWRKEETMAKKNDELLNDYRRFFMCVDSGRISVHSVPIGATHRPWKLGSAAGWIRKFDICFRIRLALQTIKGPADSTQVLKWNFGIYFFLASVHPKLHTGLMTDGESHYRAVHRWPRQAVLCRVWLVNGGGERWTMIDSGSTITRYFSSLMGSMAAKNKVGLKYWTQADHL